ncbi:DCN1-like protein 2 [Artemisia annua]|uniref:DCN1-like protein 2 n=1 Tax=Artemisia annua TaxID=35608 RepID=A0A2U1MRY3_ARTAN|nr:DCN1-like protein 2 [Artemisia annua]
MDDLFAVSTYSWMSWCPYIIKWLYYLADAIGAGCFVAHEVATMWEFSKHEFVGGLQSLGIDSPEKFHDRITIYGIQQKHMVLSACADKRIMGFD